ncbi:MAG TPA: tRNA (pseudouridine(54)-N(1))-methyltransferase TrmY [Polyangiales bacterium]
MRRFVIVGQRAKASPDFLLVDIPSTSGRLDVLVRCLRAALLVSHGVRRDTVAYLVLLGEPDRPATIRIDGAAARYLRPDERSLATLLKKVLAVEPASASFAEVRTGVAIARGGLETLEPELSAANCIVLDEAGADVREHALPQGDLVFFLGDHVGFDEPTRARLAELAAATLRIGPLGLHAEDVIAIVHNELDRRGA